MPSSLWPTFAPPPGVRSRTRRTVSPWVLGLAAMCGALGSADARAQPLILDDPAGDVRIIRTDHDADGPIDVATQRLPDLIELRQGRFTPITPWVDRFDGSWDLAGEYVRIDLVLDGLINPPGPLSFDDEFPVYDPMRYGPNPIFGYVEFDMDADPDTGGETHDPDDRYLGNVARFGGLPAEARFVGRVAENEDAFDGDVETGPFVDRSGEEFHIAFLAEETEAIQVRVESAGGDPAIFEAGETWDVEGEFFHRAHGFEDFAFMCITRPGRYKPDVVLRFTHDSVSDRTTISLVYPLTNLGAARFVGPSEPVESDDGCSSNQNSVEEALIDLQFSAMWADSFDRLLPEFQLIAGWEFNTPADHLDPTAWQAALCIGTAYIVPEFSSARYIWTDVLPNIVAGDFDGSGSVDAADAALLAAFITQFDGDVEVDEDGDPNNGSIELDEFAENFSLYDVNYDGFVNGSDGLILGDMNLDGAVDVDDIDDFVLALVDPIAYAASHGGIDPTQRGDMNQDGLLNGADIAGFIQAILTP